MRKRPNYIDPFRSASLLLVGEFHIFKSFKYLIKESQVKNSFDIMFMQISQVSNTFTFNLKQILTCNNNKKEKERENLCFVQTVVSSIEEIGFCW